MNTKITATWNGNSVGRRRKMASSSSRELSRQVALVKQAMVREFGTAISGHGQLLNSALNEAEALAWQTPYPYLFFPTLAEEKASAVSRWAARQRQVRRSSREFSLAA
jgi:hypothetical protein